MKLKMPIHGPTPCTEAHPMISVNLSVLVVGSGTWTLDENAHNTDVRMDDCGVRLGCCIACGQTKFERQMDRRFVAAECFGVPSGLVQFPCESDLRDA